MEKKIIVVSNRKSVTEYLTAICNAIRDGNRYIVLYSLDGDSIEECIIIANRLLGLENPFMEKEGVDFGQRQPSPKKFTPYIEITLKVKRVKNLIRRVGHFRIACMRKKVNNPPPVKLASLFKGEG